jgi:hypothetical protein
MKKIISLRSDLLALISLTLALIFVLVTQAPRQAAAAQAQCKVCHNVKNPHTVTIPCKDVNKYLAQHPGDHAGACQGITNEQP